MDSSNLVGHQFRQISPSNRRAQGPGDWINVQGGEPHITRGTPKNPQIPQSNINGGYYQVGKQRQAVEQSKAIPKLASQAASSNQHAVGPKAMDRVASNKKEQYELQSALQMQAQGLVLGLDDPNQIGSTRFNNTAKIQSTKNNGAKKIRIGNSVKGAASSKKKTGLNEQNAPRPQQFLAQANHSFLEIGVDAEEQFRGDTKHSFPQGEEASYEEEQYSLQKGRAGGQATSSNMLVDGSELHTMAAASRMVSTNKPSHHGPSQQVKSKSKSGNPASATRRKSSISNSRKQIAIAEPPHAKQNFNKEILAQHDFLGLGPQSNYTTTNAKNQRIGSISGDPNSMNFGQNLPIGVGTTMNSNGQGVKGVIKLQSSSQHKSGGNKLTEFNCLINANQQNQPAILQQRQVNIHNTKGAQKIPGRINKAQSQAKNNAKVAQKVFVKTGHPNEISKQMSNDSNNSMSRILNNKYAAQQAHVLGQHQLQPNFNHTQNFSTRAEGLTGHYPQSSQNNTKNLAKNLLQAQSGANKKGSQNNKRQLVQQQKFQVVQEPNQDGSAFGFGNVDQFKLKLAEPSKGLASVGSTPFGTNIYTNTQGSSSVTNKVKKAFDFDVDTRGQIKRERNAGLSTQAHNNVNNGANKAIGIMNQNNINFMAGGNSNTGSKKGGQQKQAKIKTQMNLTGPLPKHLLSPTNVANQSQGKSKHSQYFENSTEIVSALAQQYQPQTAHLNASQQFHQIPKDASQFVGFKDGNKPPLQAQYQVQLNSLNPQQDQITASTQGCNTVININIDSNTWNRQLESSYPGQQSTKGDSNALASRNRVNDTCTQPTQGSVGGHQVQYVQNNNQIAHLPPNRPGIPYQTVKRQSSSKMRRNDSISSNKSRRNNHNSNNNRRSSSSSHMNNQQQQQMQQLQQLNSLHYNQQQNIKQAVNGQPHSNTDIILNNIAKINEKLQHQQQEAVLNQQQQKLLININNNMPAQEHEPVNLSQTAKVSMIKSKSLNKEAAMQQQNKKQGQQLKTINKKSGVNSLNQTQKLAQLSNATSITVNDSMQQQMLSIIPKKQIHDGQTPVNRKPSQKQLKLAPFPKQGSQHQQQKLTLKKVTSNRKTEQQNSQMGSARTKKQNGQNRYYVQEQIQILQQSHDSANQRDNEFDQHLLDMENQIQQNQIRLRNELQQIQNVKANGQSLSSNQDQMNEMGMDVDMEDILIDNQLSMDDNLGNHSGLKQYDRQLQAMQQNLYKNNQNYPSNAAQKSKYQTQQTQNMKRQQSQHDQNVQSVESQLLQQSSQLRASNQKRGQTQVSSQISTLNGNRNTGNSRTKGKVNRLSSSKVNIEDIQIDIDGMMRHQLIMDSSLGLAAAVQNFGTKKSYTTKNQNLNKMHATQNVQSLLREAKREMLIDPNELDQIQVGGDDLTVKHTQKKRFNFHGTQNLALGNNFGAQQSRVNSQYGNSPQNKNDDYGTANSGTLSAYPNHNNYKTNQSIINQQPIIDTFNAANQLPQNQGTFGLGQINMKKQMTKQNKPDQHQKKQVQSQFINQMQQQHSQFQNGNKQPVQNQQAQMLQQQQQKQIQMQQLQKVKNQYQAQEQAVAQAHKLSKQSQSQSNSLSSSKQNIPHQFQQKSIQSQQVQQPAARDPQHSQSGTFNSQESDQRNSNLPPNSSEMLKNNNEASEENLLVEVPTSSQTNIAPASENDQELLQLPLSGAKVLKHYLKRNGLTEYEKSEILDYRQCYYLGLGAQKIKGSKQHQYNYGYDDERGDYSVVLQDHIAYRFEVVDFLGKGSFGQALKCVDHKTKEIVALKIIRNKKKFQHQAGVELKILLHLKENDPDDTNNIIRIKDYCMFRKHLVISFELFSINLYEFIKNNNFEGVSLSLIRRFAIQILQALKYLREESLIHCDLKPENILLKSPDKSGIKVIDFGSSCFSNERIYTYIQSRFYRAPEIILGIPYTTAIDMWSFGCILTELFTGVPIFPGESEQEQLSLIMQVIGLPKEEILAQATRKQVFFDEQTNEPYLSQDSQGNLRIPSSKPLDEILMCQSESFQDFIRCCLEWNPANRITPFEALMHEWIIEGLPPQVLIHHKKMLGIYESDTEDEQMNGNQSQSVIDESQNQSQAYDMEQFNHQIDSNDLSSSRIQVLNEQSINDNYDQAERSHLQNQLQIDKIISNNLEETGYQDEQSIDFYGQNVKSTEHQDYSSRYESILSHGANKNLMRNKKKISDEDQKGSDSKEKINRERAKQKHLHQPTHSDMQEDDPQWEEMEANPHINRAMGQAMRGQQVQREIDQNDEFGAMVLNDGASKSKTTNMTEILSQVNKKSKSTKNQARGHGIQYSLPKDGQIRAFQHLAAGTQALNVVQQQPKQRPPQPHVGQAKRNPPFQQQQDDAGHLNSCKMEIDEHNSQLVDMDTERDEIMDLDHHRDYA